MKTLRTFFQQRAPLFIVVVALIGIGWRLCASWRGGSANSAAQAPAQVFSFDAPPHILWPAPFQVTLISAKGRPIDANVTVEFVMPAMPMPKNVVALKEASPGHYTGTATLTMSGAWVAVITSTIPGKSTRVRRVPFNLP
ncbi:MAG: FixH family protein [Capsulimonadaceae bacterium]|nr:FixH family protein [Capsulimonadaceae bacterium]